jgi:hypothetical protein
MDFFFSWQFLLFALALVAITQGVRTTVEFFSPNNHVWEDLILPNLPMVLGAILAITCAKYAFPVEIVSLSSKAIFGAVAGLLSGHAFRMMKAALASKFAPATQDAPAANDGGDNVK